MITTDNKQISSIPKILARGDSGDHRRERIFTTVIFAVLIGFLLTTLWVGTQTYQHINNVRTTTDTARESLVLISNTIHMNDEANAVISADGPEGKMLVLTEHAGSNTYETRMYKYRGNIVQEYARADREIRPDYANVVVASEIFDFTIDHNSLITISTDQGSVSVAMRSTGGDAA